MMKNGQCPKCGERNVRSNTNRKFPALNTITLGSGTCDKRYAPMDTYICGSCGYVESYVAKSEDLNYIQEKWALVQVSSEPPIVLGIKQAAANGEVCH
jgi:ribosomal protein S27AE